jgi:ACT domain-containing protein
MKKAITELEVQALAKDGEVMVTRDMVLTPGAREFASRKGIIFRYGEEKPQSVADPISEDQLASIIEQIVIEEVKRGESESTAVNTNMTAPAMVPEAAAQAAFVDSVLGEDGKQAILNCDPDSTGDRAIVTVIGQNRPGLVAKISAVVAGCGGDLADMSQVIIDNYFSMIFIVGLGGLEANNISFRIFKEKLQDEAIRLGQVQVLVMHEGIFKAMHKV